MTASEDDSVELKVEVYRAIAQAKGYKSATKQARWHGTARSNMYRILGGGKPGALLAMRMATDCGVPFEALWRQKRRAAA